MGTQDLVHALDSALFTGEDADLDALAEQDQWARHVIRLPIAGVKCYAVENDGICRLVARRALGEPLLEYTARSGAIDDVLDEAAELMASLDAERSDSAQGRTRAESSSGKPPESDPDGVEGE